MDFPLIVETLKAQLGDRLQQVNPDGLLPHVVVGPMDVEAVGRILKETTGLDFETCACLSANDDLAGARIEMVYILYSYKQRHRFTYKCYADRAAPRVQTVSAVWPGAEWQEREQYDLLGVEFIGHPDLRRLMMPPDWEGHPLRKDYVFPDTYSGWPLARDYPIGDPLGEKKGKS